MTQNHKAADSVRRNFIEANVRQPEVPCKPGAEPAALNTVINAVLNLLAIDDADLIHRRGIGAKSVRDDAAAPSVAVLTRLIPIRFHLCQPSRT